MKYQVIFKKYEVVEVEASNMYEAEELACEILDDDSYAWMDPPDEIIVQKIEDDDDEN